MDGWQRQCLQVVKAQNSNAYGVFMCILINEKTLVGHVSVILIFIILLATMFSLYTLFDGFALIIWSTLHNRPRHQENKS